MPSNDGTSSEGIRSAPGLDSTKTCWESGDSNWHQKPQGSIRLSMVIIQPSCCCYSAIRGEGGPVPWRDSSAPQNEGRVKSLRYSGLKSASRPGHAPVCGQHQGCFANGWLPGP